MLANEGKCVVLPRGGVLVGLPVPVSRMTQSYAETHPATGWQRVKVGISEAILRNELAPGTKLPQIKELCRTWKAGRSTVKQALLSLADEGRLTSAGRGFRITAPERTDPGGSVILLISVGDDSRFINGFTPRSDEYFRLLESQCRLHGLRLVFISIWDFIKGNAAARAWLTGNGKRSVMGSIVWTLGMSWSNIVTLSALLETFDKPVAVLDERGHEPLPRAMTTDRRFRVFIMGFSEMAGREIGGYLIRRRHSSVAAFSYTPDDPVYENRLNGIRRALLSASGTSRLHVIYMEEHRPHLDMVDDLETKEPFKTMRQTAVRLISMAPLSKGTTPVLNFTSQVNRLQVLRQIADHLTPKLSAALELPGVTAWVAMNDTMAFVLQEFLIARKIRMPQQLSLVSFDDTDDAMFSGISSYNFNVPAVVNAMIDHVLQGPLSRGAFKPGINEIPGFVNERGSSGMAPGSI